MLNKINSLSRNAKRQIVWQMSTFRLETVQYNIELSNLWKYYRIIYSALKLRSVQTKSTVDSACNVQSVRSPNPSSLQTDEGQWVT
jgi:hypothetical protein